MSDLAATNCQNTRSNGCEGGFSNCLLPILLLCCCGNGSWGGDNGSCGCDIIWLFLLLSCFGCGSGCSCNMGNNCCC